VTAFAITNGTTGNPMGSALSGSAGEFTIAVGAYSGPVMLLVHGGSYIDEATGARMNVLDADDMTCVVPFINVLAGSAMSGIQITPLTSMAQAWAQNMAGGMTAANITTANTRIGAAYLGAGVDILMTHPIDPTVAGSAPINMSGMGGMRGGGNMMTTTGTSQLAAAMADFVNDLSRNKSGVTNVAEMQELMNHLSQLGASGGRL
jgi:hypothetical protein